MTWKLSWIPKALLLLGVVFLMNGPVPASANLSAPPGSTEANEPGHDIDGLLEELLRLYDTNGDGKLDPAERAKLWWDIFKGQDPSEPTNVIDEEDGVAWLIRLGYNPNTANNLWLLLLEEADDNGDGVISIQEWTKFLRERGLHQLFVLVPVTPEEIENVSVYPADLFSGPGTSREESPYDDADFLLIVPPAGSGNQ